MDASEFHDYSPDEGIERERIVGDSLLLNCGVSKGVETGSIVQDRPDGFGGAGVQRLPTRRRGGWTLRLRRGPALPERGSCHAKCAQVRTYRNGGTAGREVT